MLYQLILFPKLLPTAELRVNKDPGVACYTMNESHTFHLTSLMGPVVPASYQLVSPKYLCCTALTARPGLKTSRLPFGPTAVEVLGTFHWRLLPPARKNKKKSVNIGT